MQIHCPWVFFFPSLHGHEEDVNDEMILQNDEDDSNIDLDYGDELGNMVNMIRKKYILAYISCTNTFTLDQFDFGCYEYIYFISYI